MTSNIIEFPDLNSPSFWISVFISGILIAFLPLFGSIGKRPQSMVKAAPCSTREILKGLTGTDYISFILHLRDLCKCDIFRLRLPFSSKDLYFVSDPEVAREVLLDDQSDKTIIYKLFEPVSKGPSMFTRLNNDFKHIHARKGAAPAFSSSEVKRMSQICVKKLESWIHSTLERYIEKNETFDPSKEMLYLLFVTILEVAFEYEATHAEYEHVTKSLEKALIEFTLKSKNPFRKMFGLLFADRRQAYQARDALCDFVAHVLKAYRAKKDKSSQNTIIKLIVNNPNYENDQERVADMMAFMIGGHDTTAYTLSSTMILLSKNPEVAYRLRSELNTMDPSQLSNSDYLSYVIKETLRLVPVAPGSMKIVGRDFYFKDGSLMIPKNSLVSMSMILMGLNPKIYPNPQKFDPERWINPTKETRDALMPFSLGKRNCVGQRLACTQLCSCIPLLVSKYKFEIVEEGKLVFFLTYKYEGARLRAIKLDR